MRLRLRFGNALLWLGGLVACGSSASIATSALDAGGAEDAGGEDGASDASGMPDGAAPDANEYPDVPPPKKPLTCPGTCMHSDAGDAQAPELCDFGGACVVRPDASSLCSFSVQEYELCGDCFGCGAGCRCVGPRACACN